MAHWMKLYAELSRWRDELLQSDASDDDVIRTIKDRIEVETDEYAIHFLKSTLAHLLGKPGNESASDALYSANQGMAESKSAALPFGNRCVILDL
jgi:hypothetical protein